MIGNFLFEPPPTVSAAVIGEIKRFPVHRVYCVGRNYAAHIREMGFDPQREAPFFFQKPADALLDCAAPMPYPPNTNDLQYEAELVLAIGRTGADILEADAMSYVYGYAIGVDFTRRDRQIEARDRGRPWEVGKSFDHSAPMGPIHPATQIGHPSRGRIWLSVNGKVKQDGDLSQLVWNPAEIISILSRSFRLEPGDLIFTGTPAGIGPVAVGDVIEVGIAGLTTLALRIGAPTHGDVHS